MSIEPNANASLPGAAPGTLVHVGERKSERTEFRLIHYERDAFEEVAVDMVGPAAALRDAAAGRSTWISVTGLHEIDKIRQLLEAFAIHPLIQEDVLNTRHQPKLEDHGDYLFIVLKEIRAAPGGKPLIEHFSLILTPNAVLTFQERPSSTLDPVVTRLKGGKGFIRKRGSDYLAWAILDAVVDHYFVVLDALELASEALDDQVSDSVEKSFARDIHAFRAEVTDIYRKIRPARELVSALQRSGSPLLDPQNHAFFSDLYDHTVHAVATTEILRESVANLRDLHMAAVSNRMNEVMKVLTTFATIFLPLTFLAGIYGMNFENMPELKVSWAYPALWGVFGLVTFAMVLLFKRKRWL